MMVSMNGPIQRGLRRLTKITRPLALRSAGKQGSSTSVVRHVGRKRAGHTRPRWSRSTTMARVYIALPDGERTDWLKNVLATGSATVVSGGARYDVDRPEVIPMAEATGFFGEGAAAAPPVRCRDVPPGAPDRAESVWVLLMSPRFAWPWWHTA